jgi:hypothetical protein
MHGDTLLLLLLLLLLCHCCCCLRLHGASKRQILQPGLQGSCRRYYQQRNSEQLC